MRFEVKDLSFHYANRKRIFEHVNFCLKDGDILSILGANGAGKSTLLNCLAGVFSSKHGEILVDDNPLSRMSKSEIAKNIGYVPQIHDNSFAYSVLEYTLMGRTPYIPVYSKPSKEDYQIAMYYLKKVGMDGMCHKIYTEMSGGEQQLVTIARVLTQEARIILLDEPTNHLDYGNQHRTIEMLQQLSAEGYIIITTTHNPDHAFLLGGKAGILTSGSNLHVESVAQELTAERLTRLYGMDMKVLYIEEAKRTICFSCTNANRCNGKRSEDNVISF